MKNITLLGGALLALLAFPASGAPMKGEVSYTKDVVPILHDYCLSCHQPGGKGYEKSGLDMRTYESLLKGTKFGSVIKPGDSFTSIIIQVIEGRVHSSIKMPFGMSGGLAKDKIEILKRWVDQGAKNN
jgi:Planctomycete cytochrome C